MTRYPFILVTLLLAGTSCGHAAKRKALSNTEKRDESTSPPAINSQAENLEQRFSPPEGFTRKSLNTNSFANYLRQLPLKPAGSVVHYYNGAVKANNIYAAVVDLETGKKNLQQCADAVIRLKAEYLWAEKRFGEISFHLTSGFEVPYNKWQDGYRVAVNGNNCNWVNTGNPGTSYSSFKDYLDFIFSYAGTLSLAKELVAQNKNDLQPGDVFIRGGSPGHAVIVVDVAENEKGEKVFMLAQSYMPAQDIQILKNENDAGISPWYSSNYTDQLFTPEWTFDKAELKTWPN